MSFIGYLKSGNKEMKKSIYFYSSFIKKGGPTGPMFCFCLYINVLNKVFRFWF